MVFRKGGYLSARERWLYGDSELEIVNAYKYLGLLFTTKLSLRIPWNEMCCKGKKGVIAIFKTLRKLKCFDCKFFFKLFDTQIEPILTYAAEVWGLNNNIEMERVHTYGIKRFIFVPIHASNKMLYGETGRYPLYIRAYTKCIRYWLKLLKLPNTRICKQAYNMMLQQMVHGYENWAFQVKKSSD